MWFPKNVRRKPVTTVMENRRRALSRLLMLGVVLLGFVGNGAVSALAQSMGAPNPVDCVVEPRTLPLPIPAMTQAEASPEAVEPPSGGEPADEAIVESITETIYHSIACTNGNDLLRVLALFSDRFVADLFTGPDAVSLTAFEDYVALPPIAAVEEDRLQLLEVRDVVVLDDGRVGAIVVTGDEAAPTEDYLVLIEDGDGWLIDDSIPITPLGTPTP